MGKNAGVVQEARCQVNEPEPSPRYWFPAKTYGWGWGLAGGFFREWRLAGESSEGAQHAKPRGMKWYGSVVGVIP